MFCFQGVEVKLAPQKKKPKRSKRRSAPIQLNHFEYNCPVCGKDFDDLRYFKVSIVLLLLVSFRRLRLVFSFYS